MVWRYQSATSVFEKAATLSAVPNRISALAMNDRTLLANKRATPDPTAGTFARREAYQMHREARALYLEDVSALLGRVTWSRNGLHATWARMPPHAWRRAGPLSAPYLNAFQSVFFVPVTLTGHKCITLADRRGK
jgi:hypothetical protein